jgi:hypothetical protein
MRGETDGRVLEYELDAVMVIGERESMADGAGCWLGLVPLADSLLHVWRCLSAIFSLASSSFQSYSSITHLLLPLYCFYA